MSSEIHSVVFLVGKKGVKWDATKARKWLKDKGLKPIKKVDKVKVNGVVTQLRYRLIDPSAFKSFATKKTNDNINLVIGFR